MASKAAGLALPQHRRIRQRTEFEQAFREPCLSNKWFTVFARKNESGFSRLGVIASKRTMPKAVARNVAKRMIREVFRCNFPTMRSLDIVVRARRQFKPETFVEGRLALLQLLKNVVA